MGREMTEWVKYLPVIRGPEFSLPGSSEKSQVWWCICDPDTKEMEKV